MPLLPAPDTVTTTLPVVAPVGTVATIPVGLQLDTVAPVPLKVTVLLPCADPNPVPTIITGAPIPAADGDSLVMVSADAVTVIVVEPQIEPAQAVTAGDPVATAKAWPKLVRSFVTVVNVLSEELHVADDST